MSLKQETISPYQHNFKIVISDSVFSSLGSIIDPYFWYELQVQSRMFQVSVCAGVKLFQITSDFLHWLEQTEEMTVKTFGD